MSNSFRRVPASTRGPAARQILAFEDATWRRRFRSKLLRWYRREQRDLPWRRSSDPYTVWVSEIMLQQTQVATVKSYFQRFIRKFPTVTKLAKASESEVLRLWEGLGYYRRARQLHRAAKQIEQQHDGEFPQEFAEVLALPGIGRYTAGAILSISLDQRLPILEANTFRLLSRLSAYRDDPMKSDGQRMLWRMAEQLLPRIKCGEFNQALMELGSLVCTPKNPNCDDCPIAQLCPTNELSLQQKIPALQKRVAYEEVTEAAVVIRRGGNVVLRQCAAGERWAGLWDFPRFPISEAENGTRKQMERELMRLVQQKYGLRISLGDELAVIKHGVTKYRITLHCLTAKPAAGGRLRKPARWVPWNELESYPLSVTGRKISKLALDRNLSLRKR